MGSVSSEYTNEEMFDFVHSGQAASIKYFFPVDPRPYEPDDRGAPAHYRVTFSSEPGSPTETYWLEPCSEWFRLFRHLYYAGEVGGGVQNFVIVGGNDPGGNAGGFVAGGAIGFRVPVNGTAGLLGLPCRGADRRSL